MENQEEIIEEILSKGFTLVRDQRNYGKSNVTAHSVARFTHPRLTSYSKEIEVGPKRPVNLELVYYYYTGEVAKKRLPKMTIGFSFSESAWIPLGKPFSKSFTSKKDPSDQVFDNLTYLFYLIDSFLISEVTVLKSITTEEIAFDIFFDKIMRARLSKAFLFKTEPIFKDLKPPLLLQSKHKVKNLWELFATVVVNSLDEERAIEFKYQGKHTESGEVKMHRIKGPPNNLSRVNLLQSNYLGVLKEMSNFGQTIYSDIEEEFIF